MLVSFLCLCPPFFEIISVDRIIQTLINLHQCHHLSTFAPSPCTTHLNRSTLLVVSSSHSRVIPSFLCFRLVTFDFVVTFSHLDICISGFALHRFCLFAPLTICWFANGPTSYRIEFTRQCRIGSHQHTQNEQTTSQQLSGARRCKRSGPGSIQPDLAAWPPPLHHQIINHPYSLPPAPNPTLVFPSYPQIETSHSRPCRILASVQATFRCFAPSRPQTILFLFCCLLFAVCLILTFGVSLCFTCCLLPIPAALFMAYALDSSILRFLTRFHPQTATVTLRKCSESLSADLENQKKIMTRLPRRPILFANIYE